MPQLDSLRVVAKDIEQRFQAIHRFRRVFKACGKLKQQTSKLFRLGQRRNAGFKFIKLLGSPSRFIVRKPLPNLDGEFEIIRGTFRPAFSRLRAGRPIKRGIDLDGVEVPRVELELVGFLEGIKNAGP